MPQISYKNHPKKIMKNTLKTITLLLSVLFITSLVNVKEIRAEGVKKINSKSTEQNKRVTTEYKSELVDKIIKAYKLDPKNNPKDQCTLTNVLDNIFTRYGDEGVQNDRDKQLKKLIGISNITFEEVSGEDNISSINGDVFSQGFSIYRKGDKDGQPNSWINFYFDKFGNPIAYDEAGDPPSDICELDRTEFYETKQFFSARNKKDKWNGKDLDDVDENHSNINIITKGDYVLYFNIK